MGVIVYYSKETQIKLQGPKKFSFYSLRGVHFLAGQVTFKAYLPNGLTL